MKYNWYKRNTPLDIPEEEESYLSLFFGDNYTKHETSEEKSRTALETAYTMRTLETELLWKRAAHFWLFIAAIGFVYYEIIKFILIDDIQLGFALIGKNTLLYLLLSFINCIGFIVSYVWLEVIRSSRFWIGNWEKHIDMLEYSFSGNLHKIVISNTKKFPILSGAKLNQALAFMCIFIWFICEIFTCMALFQENFFHIVFGILIYLCVLVALTCSIILFCKSSVANKKKHSAY